MDAFIARQPIFTRSLSVYGYELFFRSGLENTFRASDPDQASAKVIADSSLLFDLETLTGGKRAFINTTREILLQEYVHLLPAKLAVVEILESVTPESEVLEACRALKTAGYTLVLDDFVDVDASRPFAELADIIKIDLLASSEEEQQSVMRRLGRPSLRFLAEKVETQEALEAARQKDYSFFQGYFFCKPLIVARKDIPAYKLNYFQILKQIQEPELDFGHLEAIVKREMSLSYRFLRYINSAHFGWRGRIDSIKRALVLLGEAEVKRWLSLSVLANIAEDKPRELMVQAVIRGRICESLASLSGFGRRSQELFLMGLFSLLDAVLGRPLPELLEELPVAGDVKQALTGERNRLRRVLECVTAYERGDWAALAEQAETVGVDGAAESRVYTDALEWSNRTFKPLPSLP
jgi:EAL and modified HD-GYP domain-containing signal transduction protein